MPVQFWYSWQEMGKWNWKDTGTKVSVGSVKMGYLSQHNCYCWQDKGYLVGVVNIHLSTASEWAMHKY